MPTRVLADFHHSDLYESLRILFEERLDWELYRPIGMEWYREQFWHVQPFEVTALQYLSTENLPTEPDLHGSVPLNTPACPPNNGVYYIIDGHRNHRRHKAITLAAAKDMKFDIVLSSILPHFDDYERFRQLYCPQAKHIYQAGNHHPAPASALNMLDSTLYPNTHVPNRLHYHQEFSLDEFYPGPPFSHTRLTSFMHLHYLHYQDVFYQLRDRLPGWVTRNHGAGGEDGPVLDIADEFRKTAFVWHAKKGGDGYGYNIFNAFATGRPVITYGHDYHGKSAQALFTDGQTMIDLDNRSLDEVAALLQAAAEDWPAWHERVLQRFREVVNFDAEFEQIKAFLARLL